ncbi:MAG TPA: cation:proton antiporter [Gemmatimonadales bacterium]|nr:cation:proton antiporter [Gemmatimonadales bacterium]
MGPRAWALAACLPWLLGAAGHGDVARFFVVLAIMLVAGKFAGELFERLGQPAVLGELLAGILLGSSALGVIPTAPDDPLSGVIRLLAQVGVVVLLFEIGLETDLKAMARVGGAATSVALVGVAVPFFLGFLYWISPLHSYEDTLADATTTAIFVGATLTATSVGITARVLGDLRCMNTVEARLVLGAAVIDDVLGLVILGVVSGLAAGAAVSLWGIARILAVAVGFLVLALALGFALASRIFGLIDRMRVRGVLLVSAFAFLLLLAALADRAGSALIIGAFAAGIILSGTNQFDAIEERMKPVADIFTPVFFLSIGAAVDVGLWNPFDPASHATLAIGAALFAIAVLGKLASGWAAPWLRFNRWAVGIGMAPRGEVGLIFAQIGLTAGVLSSGLFSGILLMVIGTTLVAPPLLKLAFDRWGSTRESGERA